MQSTSTEAQGDRSRESLRVKDEYLAGVLKGEKHLLFDGAMGTMLQKRGLAPGELPDLLCLSNPEVITDVHRAYVEAGSQVVTTNTFGSNREKLGDAATVTEVFAAAVACARAANPQYVAGDIGPTGELLDPYGDLAFEEAYDLFAEEARAAAEAGADLIIVETMASIDEAKAAVLAAQENTDLPVFVTMTFGKTGHTFLGTSTTEAACELSELGVDALGINCSLGPADLAPLVHDVLENTDRPVIVQANAGLPEVVAGQTIYTITPEEYASAVRPMIEEGVAIVGGCCGTDPRYIEALAELVLDRVPTK